jgi:hypothetical protein
MEVATTAKPIKHQAQEIKGLTDPRTAMSTLDRFLMHKNLQNSLMLKATRSSDRGKTKLVCSSSATPML